MLISILKFFPVKTTFLYIFLWHDKIIIDYKIVFQAFPLVPIISFGMLILSILLLFSSLFLFSTTNTTSVFSLHIAFAHITGNRTQLWIDKDDNIKMQFIYLPDKPLVETPTELKFSVQDSKTGIHLKDRLARVIIISNITGKLRTFEFTNITVRDGDFTVKYRFPDSGTYQVISRVDSKDVPILASFNVVVPFQPLGIINANNVAPLIFPVVLPGTIGVIFIIVLMVITKRREKTTR